MKARLEENGRRYFASRFALGYVQGWRGPVIYWLMRDGALGIYRCKVCDPSVVNWEALQATIEPQPEELSDQQRSEQQRSMLADFPVINKSFNLSYSGHDG